MTPATSSGARTRAREVLVQALYQKHIAGHDVKELLGQFHEQAAYQRVDQEYFDDELAAICASQAALEQTIDELIDRPLEQLDPVERGILLVGTHPCFRQQCAGHVCRLPQHALRPQSQGPEPAPRPRRYRLNCN